MKKPIILLWVGFLSSFICAPNFAQEQTQIKENSELEQQEIQVVQKKVELKEIRKIDMEKFKEAQPIQREEKMKLEQSTKE